jgi:arylsulfatase A-like enzyme
MHGVIGPLDALPFDIPTLAELLAQHGWETGAVTEDGMLVAGAGFQRGFAYYRENKAESIWEAKGQVDVTFRHGLEWLQEHRDEKFFLFLHTYQVHSPYLPPPEYDRFKTYRDGDREVPITPQTSGAIRGSHAYAGEVLYTDHEIGILLAGLRDLRLDERTLVVFTSDHGEEFGEHGWIGHDETVYDEVLHVPLLMRARASSRRTCACGDRSRSSTCCRRCSSCSGSPRRRPSTGGASCRRCRSPARRTSRSCSRSW